VGHETDWTLIDLVADARAPTPTKAAEWAVPKNAELAESTEKFGGRLTAAARRSLQSARTHLKAAARGLPRLEDIIALPRQRFDACEKRLARALLANTRAHHTRYVRTASRLRPGPIRQHIAICGERIRTAQARSGQALLNRLAARRDRLESSGKLLASLSYQGVLQRGFVLVRDSDGRMVRNAANLHAGDALELEFRDGRVDAETRSVRTTGVKDSGGPASASAAEPDPQVRRTRRPRGSGQGSLF
jgi:exodeoxyribonuclease VII large subunit